MCKSVVIRCEGTVWIERGTGWDGVVRLSDSASVVFSKVRRGCLECRDREREAREVEMNRGTESDLIGSLGE